MGKDKLNYQFPNPYSPSRILICGLGSIGRRHARILDEIFPDTELAVYRSGHGGDCAELALMTHQFSDLNSSVEWKPDAAVIASPAPFHQHQALYLTSKGIPVLIEKPLGDCTESHEGWHELLNNSKNVPILTGYVLRYDPCTVHIKEKLDTLKLGKILEADFYCGSWLPDWRPDIDYRHSVSSRRCMGGGALLELSHELDLARLFFDNFNISFASLGQSGLLEIDVEDSVVLVGSSSKCPHITMRLNFCSRPSRRSILIRCEKGEIIWDLLNGNVSTIDINSGSESFNSSSSADDRFRGQARHFIDCISTGTNPFCSLADGLEVLRLINVCRSKASSCFDQAGIIV